MEDATSIAPLLNIPEREIVAVEHPMVIKNVDNGLKTFGVEVHRLMYPEDYDESLPLYLRPGDPTGSPILSHNVSTSNLVFKITVPRRTGRKRKRGSQDAFSASEVPDHRRVDAAGTASLTRSNGPAKILRRLQDNVGKYKVEPIGNIQQTHRFRALTDFHFSTAHAPFMTKMRDTILPGDLESVKRFRIDPSQGPKPMDEIIPPPRFTEHPLPFNWGYKQNSQITVNYDEVTGEKFLKNSSAVKKIHTYYMSSTDPEVPQGPLEPPPTKEPITANLIRKLKAALEERPMWTRRALSNRIGKIDGHNLFKDCLQYVGYQFRGGPWRDSVIKFGVDPRKDPKYRIYQTLFFKIYNQTDRKPGTPWHDIRSEYTRRIILEDETLTTHLFDGNTIHLDGKLWQVCDITDPVCLRIIAEGALRDTCDLESDGWYCNGTMAKLKAVMRCKISAIQMGRHIPDEEFEETFKYPEVVTEKRYMNVPVPDFRGNEQEQAEWQKNNPGKKLPKKYTTSGPKASYSKGTKTGQRGRPSEGASQTPSKIGGAAAQKRTKTTPNAPKPAIEGSQSTAEENTPYFPLDPRLQESMTTPSVVEEEEMDADDMDNEDLDGDGEEIEGLGDDSDIDRTDIDSDV